MRRLCDQCGLSVILCAKITRGQMSTKHGLACARVDPLDDGGSELVIKTGAFFGGTSGCHRQGDYLSRKPGSVREFDSCQGNVGELSGKKLVREKLPKTVYCKLHICVHTGI